MYYPGGYRDLGRCQRAHIEAHAVLDVFDNLRGYENLNHEYSMIE